MTPLFEDAQLVPVAAEQVAAQLAQRLCLVDGLQQREHRRVGQRVARRTVVPETAPELGEALWHQAVRLHLLRALRVDEDESAQQPRGARAQRGPRLLEQVAQRSPEVLVGRQPLRAAPCAGEASPLRAPGPTQGRGPQGGHASR